MSKFTEDITFYKSIIISSKEGDSQTNNGEIGQLRFNQTSLKFEGYHCNSNSNTGADIFGNKWRSLTQDVASADDLGIIRVGNNLNINPFTGILSSVAAGESRIYQLVITVSPIVGAADYQSINVAIADAIGTPAGFYLDGTLTSNLGSAPSPIYPFVILLSPGKFSEPTNTITLPDYVSLRGENNYNSILTQNIGSNASITNGSASMIIVGQNCEIKNMIINLADSGTSSNSNAIYSLNKSNVVIDNCIMSCSSNITTTQNTYGIYMDGGDHNSITNNKLTFNSSTLLGTLNTIVISNSTPKLTNNYIDILTPNTNITTGIDLMNCIGTDSITDKLYIENLTLSNNYYNTVSGGENTGIRVTETSLVIKNSDIEVSNDTSITENYGILFRSVNPIAPYVGNTTSNVVSFINTKVGSNGVNTINSSNTSAINFLTENYQRGQYINVSGSSSNDGVYKIAAHTSSVLTLESGFNLINEDATELNTIKLKGLFDINIYNSIINASTNTIKNGTDSEDTSNYICNLYNVMNETSSYDIAPSFVFYTNYKTLTVGKVNCDFTSLYNAMYSITDNSSNNRYLIKIQSGTYDETTYILCKQYVDIEGNGEDNTILQFTQSANTTGTPSNTTSCILVCSNISIKNLTIKNASTNYTAGQTTSTVIYNPNSMTNFILENIIINSTCSSVFNSGIYIINGTVITLRNINLIINSTNTSIQNNGMYIINCSVFNMYNISSITNSIYTENNCSLYLKDSECNIYNPNFISHSAINYDFCVYTSNNNNMQKLVQIYNGQIRAYIAVDYSIYADNYYTIMCNGVQLLGETFTNSISSYIYCNSCYTFTDENDKTNIQSLNSRGQNEQSELTYSTLTIGDSAGKRNATGTNNVFIGVNSGSNVTSAFNNTFLGYNTGKTLNNSSNNTLIGSNVGESITTGEINTIIGSQAGKNLTTGNTNTITGTYAGNQLTTGFGNTLNGTSSGLTLTTGFRNTFMGDGSGLYSNTAVFNTFIGSLSGYDNNSGNNNTYLGYQSGYQGISSNNSVLIGTESGYTNLSSNIVAVGTNAGYMNSNSIKNTYIGHQSGYNNLSGDCNTYLGHNAGLSNTSSIILAISSGSYNIAIGNEAGYSITSGSRNILIGSTKSASGTSNDAAGWALENGTDNIYIGANSGSKATTSINNVFIGSDIGTSITTASNNILIGKNTGNAISNNNGNIIIGSETGNDNTYGNALIIGQNSGVGYTGTPAFVIGHNAGKNITGINNMFIGQNSGGISQTGKTGNYNLAIGPYSGFNLKAGSRNVMVGSGEGGGGGSVGGVITSGCDNTLLGYTAGRAIQTGIGNTLIGSNSGANLTSGANNLILGHNSAYNLGTGSNNVSLGPESGYYLSSGNGNIFSGYQAGYNTTSGDNNINIGYQTGYQGLTTLNNIHIGYRSGYQSVADNNLFLGSYAGLKNTTGKDNIFIGKNSGEGNNTNNRQIGNNNIFMGSNSGNKNDNGTTNIFLGLNAGQNNTNGSKNVFIGENTGRDSIISRNIFIGSTSNSSKGIGYKSQTIGEKNLFIGHDVGIENTTGGGNIFLGDSAGQKNTSAEQNIYIGTYAGNKANNSNANYNIAIGFNAGKDNISGKENILIGKQAGAILQESNQIFIGTGAGLSTTTANNNIFIGTSAGASITTQPRNVIIGYNAMSLGQGENNIIIGSEAGTINNGDDNIFIGNLSGLYNNTGNNNTFIGSATGVANNAGFGNTFLGTASGISNVDGSDNIFVGKECGYLNINGVENIFMGYRSGFTNYNGDDNICMGYQAGAYNSNGSANICLGYQSGLYNQNNFNTFIGYRSGINNIAGIGNTFIGFKTGYNSNNNINTYFGNLVGQLNDGYNNFFLGYEEVDDVNNLSAITNYNNKFAIYKNTQSGITSNTTGTCTILIGGDFSTGTVGIGTLVPDTYGVISETSTKLVVIGKVKANSYIPFTGAHNVNISININNTININELKEGFIMSATGNTVKSGISNTIVTVTPSILSNDKTVYGVYSGSETVNNDNISTTIYYVNALGEGCVLISNYGGEIQNGDYITTCPIMGYGSLQSDDFLHSYTVAKCTETIDWSNITDTLSYNGKLYKIYLASCTYHCG